MFLMPLKLFRFILFDALSGFEMLDTLRNDRDQFRHYHVSRNGSISSVTKSYFFLKTTSCARIYWLSF